MKSQLLSLLLLPALALAGESSPAAEAEIAHLLNHLGNSGCMFKRNNSWYSAEQAAEHLDNKYQYLRKRNLIASAEDFIAGAASQSSISGRRYQVQCAADEPVSTGRWLADELAAYRSARE